MLVAVRQALRGFESSTEQRYLGHLDAIAFAWFSRLVIVTTTLAAVIIVTRGKFVLDSFSTLKLGCHALCIAFACLGYLVGDNIRRPWTSSGRFAFTVAAMTILAERLYHILFLLGLLEWTAIAQEFLTLDGTASVAVFQTVLSAVAPSLGIPLTFHSQLMLRIGSEIIEAALMYKVSILYGPLNVSIWMHLLTRILLSLSTGLVIDVIRRQAFLNSITGSKVPLSDQTERDTSSLPVRPHLAKTYSASLPPSKHITLKSSPHRIQVMEESIPSYNHAALARRIKAHHPETYKLYLRIREGCLVFDTVISSTGKSPFEVLDLIKELHPESHMDSFESPMMLRAYVRGPAGEMISDVYAYQNEEWSKTEELDSSIPSKSVADLSLSLDPVICLSNGERTKRLVGMWDGPPPPTDSWVEAVIRGQPLKFSCFPDPSSWTKGTEIKITLFLDEAHPDEGGIIDINVWSPPAQLETNPSLPQLLVISSRMLLLPSGSDSAVHELAQLFSQAGGSPSQPWGTLKGLTDEISLILWASSDASNLDPDLVPAYQKAARTLIQWANDCNCLSLKQVITKASKNIKMNRLAFILGPFASALSGPWKYYPPSPAWISLFGTSLIMASIVKLLYSESIGFEFAANLWMAVSYLVCILVQTVASRQSSSSSPIVTSAHRVLAHAGVFLFISKAILGLLILSGTLPVSETRIRKFYGNWSSYTQMYLTTKTCYSLFERFDLRVFMILVLGIDAPIVIATMKIKINCSLATSVTFGILANIYCVVIRVLYDRWCAKQERTKQIELCCDRRI